MHVGSGRPNQIGLKSAQKAYLRRRMFRVPPLGDSNPAHKLRSRQKMSAEVDMGKPTLKQGPGIIIPTDRTRKTARFGVHGRLVYVCIRNSMPNEYETEAEFGPPEHKQKVSTLTTLR